MFNCRISLRIQDPRGDTSHSATIGIIIIIIIMGLSIQINGAVTHNMTIHLEFSFYIISLLAV